MSSLPPNIVDINKEFEDDTYNKLLWFFIQHIFTEKNGQLFMDKLIIPQPDPGGPFSCPYKLAYTMNEFGPYS